MMQAITHLSLHHFRNYTSLDLTLSSAPVVLTGPNGAGKTNVLEALSLFSPGRGLRGAKLSDLSSSSSDLFRGSIDSRNKCENDTAEKVKFEKGLLWASSIILSQDIQLSTGLENNPLTGSEKRIHKIQHESVKGQGPFTEWLTVFWLTPETDRLFLESPSDRRKFVDRFVYGEDPLHSERLNRYDHALRERLMVLRQGGDPLWLSSLEEQIASQGVAIAVARQQLMKKLNQGQEYQHPLFPRFQSQMIGEIDSWIENDYAVNVEARFMEALTKNRNTDRESGTTKIGPHRSDWEMIHQTKNMTASFCSTGEQKILLIAALFSFIQHKVRNDDRLTVLLLDDVIAHLDFHHRVVLFDQICALQNTHQEEFKGSVHTWLTGTDPLLFETLMGQGQFFCVDNATLTLG